MVTIVTRLIEHQDHLIGLKQDFKRFDSSSKNQKKYVLKYRPNLMDNDDNYGILSNRLKDLNTENKEIICKNSKVNRSTTKARLINKKDRTRSDYHIDDLVFKNILEIKSEIMRDIKYRKDNRKDSSTKLFNQDEDFLANELENIQIKNQDTRGKKVVVKDLKKEIQDNFTRESEIMDLIDINYIENNNQNTISTKCSKLNNYYILNKNSTTMNEGENFDENIHVEPTNKNYIPEQENRKYKDNNLEISNINKKSDELILNKINQRCCQEEMTLEQLSSPKHLDNDALIKNQIISREIFTEPDDILNFSDSTNTTSIGKINTDISQRDKETFDINDDISVKKYLLSILNKSDSIDENQVLSISNTLDTIEEKHFFSTRLPVTPVMDATSITNYQNKYNQLLDCHNSNLISEHLSTDLVSEFEANQEVFSLKNSSSQIVPTKYPKDKHQCGYNNQSLMPLIIETINNIWGIFDSKSVAVD